MLCCMQSELFKSSEPSLSIVWNLKEKVKVFAKQLERMQSHKVRYKPGQGLVGNGVCERPLKIEILNKQQR